MVMGRGRKCLFPIFFTRVIIKKSFRTDPYKILKNTLYDESIKHEGRVKYGSNSDKYTT